MSFLSSRSCEQVFSEPSRSRGAGVHLQGRHHQNRQGRVRHRDRPFGMRKEHVAQHHCRVGNSLSEGGVIFNGREASGPGLDRMVVFQNFALMPWMTVFENIALAVRSAYPDWSHEQVTAHVHKYIALVGLTGAEDKRPAALSGGMKQRVGLARAFSIEPKVLPVG